jgi:hypothetical protein
MIMTMKTRLLALAILVMLMSAAFPAFSNRHSPIPVIDAVSAATATATPVPTAVPTPMPTPVPTPVPTIAPTPEPTVAPSGAPTDAPTAVPTDVPADTSASSLSPGAVITTAVPSADDNSGTSASGTSAAGSSLRSGTPAAAGASSVPTVSKAPSKENERETVEELNDQSAKTAVKFNTVQSRQILAISVVILSVLAAAIITTIVMKRKARRLGSR